MRQQHVHIALTSAPPRHLQNNSLAAHPPGNYRPRPALGTACSRDPNSNKSSLICSPLYCQKTKYRVQAPGSTTQLWEGHGAKTCALIPPHGQLKSQRDPPPFCGKA